jgi:hypothetical protein
MKYLLILTVSALIWAGCKKEPAADATALSSEPPAGSNKIAPLPAYRWTSLPTGFPNMYPYTDGGTSTIVMPVGDDIYLASGTGYEHVFKFNKATQKFQVHTVTNPNSLGFSQFIPGHHFLFSYNGLIYGGLANNGSDTSYVFALEPGSSNITQKARFPGVKTGQPVSFQIGNKGYVISGYNSSTSSQVWEYDFAANTWTLKGNSPLGNRQGAVAYVINNKVYMGLGYVRTLFNGQWINLYKKDWIQYTPGSSWFAVKTDFPGEGRFDALGYVLNEQAYLGFGVHTSPYERLVDFWKYNPGNNTWRQENDWPGNFLDAHGNYSSSPFCFSLFTDGDVGLGVKGNVNQLWRYSTSSLVIL